MKKTLVGVYETYGKALQALSKLQESGFPIKQLSIIGKADLVNGHVYIRANDAVESTEVSMGTIAGTALGLLTGVGIFAIPGLGLLYGAGAFVGAMAGVEGGFITGGVIAILTSLLGVDEALAVRYEKRLNEDKFLVPAQGNKKQIKLAHEILHTQGLSLELDMN